MQVSLDQFFGLKDGFRRIVREIFVCWILPIVPTMLYMEGPRMSEEHAAYAAILICALTCIPLWLFYRLIRFALGR